jgi:Ran GTPase-activating protein (RanGAP) involved in mRNA processing and transport
LTDFGELRSIAHGAPSHEAFGALIEVFERATAPPDEVEGVWVPYAAEHVRAWPVYMRTLSVRDPARLGGTPPPWMELLGALHLGRHAYPDGFLRELLSSSRVAGLERLCYDHARPPEGFLSWLAASPHLGALRHIEVRTPATPEDFLALAASETLRLRSFSAHGGLIGDDGAVAFASSPVFAELDTLSVTACGIGDRGARALGESPFMPRLHRLRVQDNAFGAEGAVAILSVHGLPWTHLDLSSNRLGPDAIPAFVAAQRLGKPMNLSLDACGLGDGDAAALAGAKHLGELRSLSMRRNHVGDGGARALAEAPMVKLTNLSLMSNAIGSAGALALLRSPHLGRLEFLDLDDNDFSDDTFEAAPDASSASYLRELYLSDSAVGPRLLAEVLATRAASTVTTFYCRGARLGAEGGRAFGAREATLSHLEELDLACTDGPVPLGDEGFAALLAPGSASRLTALWELDLGSNGLTDASAQVLPDAGLRALRTLCVDANPISDAWVRALVDSQACRHLTELNLDLTFVTDLGLEHIAQAPLLELLTVLELVDTRATARGLRAVLTSAHLPKLSMLTSTAPITDEVALALTACPHRGALGHLTVGDADLSGEAWRALATAETLRGLAYFEHRGAREPMYDALEELRAEGAALNPWTSSHARPEVGR